jgi:glycine cleavage system aminomethyltransferase T
MTESSINSQVLTLRKTGGYAVVGNLGLIGVSGVDAGKFLQFRTTNDVLSLKPGQGQLNSLLDRTAHLQGVVSVHRLEDGFWVVAEKSNIDFLQRPGSQQPKITDCGSSAGSSPISQRK